MAGLPTPFGVSLSASAVVFLLLVGAGLVKGTLGFGSGLLSVPIVIQVYPPGAAIAALTLPLWLGNVPVLVADGVPWKTLRGERWLVALTAVGTVVGVLLLASASPGAVSLAVGGYLLVFLATRHTGVAVGDRVPDRGLGPVSGTVGGLINGAVLAGGPVFVSYFQATRVDKDQFATTLSAVFFLSMTIRLAGLVQFDQLPFPSPTLAVGFLIPLWLGIVGGTRLRSRVPEDRFETVVNVLLAAIALKLLSEGLPI